MTVEQLILELSKVEDKTLEVSFSDGDPFCGGSVNNVEVADKNAFGNLMTKQVILYE